LSLATTVGVFMLAIWLAHRFQPTLVTFGATSPALSVIGYLAILVTEVIAAPISSAPLIPVASAVWGPLVAGTLTLVGWTLGSALVFQLVRLVGRPALARFVNLSQAEHLITRLPAGNLTLAIVVIRLTVPIDLVSYALGLVPGVPLTAYLVGTLLGYAPYAYLFAYGGSFPM
jgi:uncharacterized membrane protein YdjX (TVP38/TMEM64 family)